MEIRYSSHAVERMFQRRISARDVESLLANPDGLIRQSRDRVIAHKKMRGRQDNSVAVVDLERRDAWEVMTVMVNFEVRK